MKNIISLLFISIFVITGCKSDTQKTTVATTKTQNVVTHASGLEIYRYNGYSVVKVTRPWPEATQSYTYVLQQKGAMVPDSLKGFTTLNVPIKSIIATSTTHIPSLEMLGVENTLVGFPGTQWVSSEKTRALIDSGKVKEAGANENLNTEVVLDLQPDAVVAFAINSTNKTLTALEQSGIKVLFNGDWTEQSPLGKAEWIKFFGELYGLQDKADAAFSKIEKDYNDALKLAQNVANKPTIMAGAMLNDQWLMPGGGSWAALFLKDAGANYLWADTNDTGSLNLSYEVVLEKAQNADFWIGPSQFTSLKEMIDANPHYAQFKAFKNKQVYSFSVKTGKTGGLLFYELAPNRPDLVLKDLVSILHPELLPNHKLQFFEKLK
ncbi:ABC transporter substrate-binding protein [Flavobacterium akiainvivens]|uniref:ABC transporter substrate-binding protein n=1 Tax=Flavobacterium akiainvivens TaxID=1202724 RepID=A0A0M9VI46_9FLAO|nr:ABC transporter substrate-binding protein [Flavobacterium akiainvivens]KOS06242.1 ABC transporter substrate-binding protein [Flavobacterium akiainvivens]SFQ18113.1 iron complex transport system substrate-binding protein [Flavobacterium akiainvivens]